MIAYLLQVTFCLAFFYGFYHLALRKETMFDTNRMYLLGTLAISLVLPLIKIYIDYRDAQASMVLPSYVYVGSYISDFSSGISAPATKSFPWGKVIAAVYITGVAIMSLRLFIALKQIVDIRKHGTEMILSGQRCIISAQVKSPFSFFNSIYLPKDHAFDQTELNEVIAHELAHVRAHHTWDVILIELACIKLWPSPMIFLYRKSLKEVHEYVADAAVLKDTPWENYAQLLVNQQHKQLQNILSNQLIYSQLKKRLLMMNQERSGTAARYKYLGLIPVLLLAMIFFSFREKPSSIEPNAHLTHTRDTNERNILYVTDDHRYFMGTQEITKAQIASAMAEATKGEADPRIKVIMDDGITAGELGEIDDLGFKQKIRVTFYSDEDGKYEDYKSALKGGSPVFNNDTLPDTHVIAKKSNAPVNITQQAADHSATDHNLPMPVFPGCDDVPVGERGTCGMIKLQEYVSKHMSYPENLKKAGIQGRVVVKFVVDANGYVKDAVIHESLQQDADRVVLDIVNGMNTSVGKWRPARKDGKSYDVEMMLPVSFALNDFDSKPEPENQVDVPARFPGCEHITDATERNNCAQEKMMKFVYSNIMYPKEDREKGIQGTGVVQFVITSAGLLSDIKVLRSPGPGIQAELERLMNLMAAIPEKWMPAQKDGKAVDYQLILPVQFKLQDDEPKQESPAPTSSAAGVAAKSISVVPNPASETITVQLVPGTQAIHVYSAAGKLVLSQNITDKNISRESMDISSLPAGHYTVQLKTSSHPATGSFTIVK